MRADIREVLRDGAATPGSELDMPRLLGRSRRLRWHRRLSVLAVAAAVAFAVSGIVVVAQREPSRPLTVATGGPGRASVLEVPPVGEVRADFLDDGTPVFVAHDTDDGVRVVSAIDAHGNFGVRDLVWWCPTSEGFEEPQSGSSYDSRGRKRGGPAPSGLVTYRSRLIEDGSKVRVGEPRSPAGRDPSTAGEISCFMGATNLPAAPVVRHEFPMSGRSVLNPRQAVNSDAGRFVQIRGVLVADEGEIRLCQRRDQARCTNGVGLGDVHPSGGPAFVAAGGLFLGRVVGDELIDVVFVDVAYEQSTEPSGFFTGLPSAALEVRSLPSLTFQANSFEVPSGVVQLDYASLGGAHALAIDDPRFTDLKLVANEDSGGTGRVRLDAGTYVIFCDVPGHRAAGEEAIISVTPGSET